MPPLDSTTLTTKIEGKVASIGDHGNLITDIAIAAVADASEDETTVVKFGGHETFGIFPADHGQPESTMVASCGPSGFVEIEIVGIPLAEMLGIGVGEKVEVRW